MRRRRLAALGIVAASAAAAAGVALGAPGDISLVSVSSSEAPGNQPAEASAVSADGRFVAFTSAADLAGTQVNAVAQLYVRDRVAGTTVLASANAAGAPAGAAVEAQMVENVLFSISGNGRYAVFSTAASLTAADGDATLDVYRKDLQTGAVALVSVNSAGQKANAAIGGDPDISYDGRRVVFTSGAATNLIAPDANGTASDVLVRDLAASTTVLAAQSAAGVQANGTTERPAISADGRIVAFEAVAGTNNLLPGDPPMMDVNDIVVRNLAAGTTAGASDPTVTSPSNFPDISGDGRYVVFETGQAYDPANDVGANDAYRRDMVTGAITLASARDGVATGGNQGGARPAISADGARVAFRSASTDLFGTDANAVADVYVRDLGPRVTRRASVQANGTTETNTPADRGVIAGNGSIVSFVNDDQGATPELIVADTNNLPDVLAKELTPTDTAPPAVALSGATGTASDPSGIGEVTVNGAAVAVGAGGTFPVSVAPGTQTVRAVDGAGNAATATRTITPAVAGRPAALRPRIQRLKASLKGKVLTVRFRLAADARVTVTLLRRTVRLKPRRRVVLTALRPQGLAVAEGRAAHGRPDAQEAPGGRALRREGARPRWRARRDDDEGHDGRAAQEALVGRGPPRPGAAPAVLLAVRAAPRAALAGGDPPQDHQPHEQVGDAEEEAVLVQQREEEDPAHGEDQPDRVREGDAGRAHPASAKWACSSSITRGTSSSQSAASSFVTLTKFAVMKTLVTPSSAKMRAPSGDSAGSEPALYVWERPSVVGRSRVNLTAFGFGVGSGTTSVICELLRWAGHPGTRNGSGP